MSLYKRRGKRQEMRKMYRKHNVGCSYGVVITDGSKTDLGQDRSKSYQKDIDYDVLF
jgi:hypothetical protein